MRRIWGEIRDTIVEYICCEPDDTWHYSATPRTWGEPTFDKSKTRPVPRNSAIRKVKMWGFPIHDEEREEEDVA